MKTYIITLSFLFGLFIGAVFHEIDLSQNFHRDGNAHAWFVTIKCEDCQK